MQNTTLSFSDGLGVVHVAIFTLPDTVRCRLRVGHVNFPVAGYCDALRPVELPLAAAHVAPLAEEPSVGGEAQDEMVDRVHHLDRVIAGHGDAGRVFELPFSAAVAAPLVEKHST